MEQAKKNKEFIIGYFNAISGASKTVDLLSRYITDDKLLNHIQFFESAFPKYEMLIDEMMAEGNRVLVRARVKGRHEGEMSGIPATYKEIELPFVISYGIQDNRIVDHWMMADQMMLMEQLGVMKQPA